MLNSKKFLVAACFILGVSQSEAGINILRNQDGSVALMDQFEATGISKVGKLPDACKRAGKGHLPTIRELAMVSQAYGAKGILEVNEVQGDPPQYYFLLSPFNPGGKKDEFYFNWENYKMPNNAIWSTNWFWSSSTFSQNPYVAYYLVGDTGGIALAERIENDIAVLCVSDSDRMDPETF